MTEHNTTTGESAQPPTQAEGPLPDLGAMGLKALVFDLDGVVTDTAAVHARAWKHLFDAFLRDHAARTGTPFIPFDEDHDYTAHVDGLPRYDGVATFLAARGIDLPRGTPDDPPDAPTICGLGNRKNAEFRAVLSEQGVTVFDASVRLIEHFRAKGLKTAVNSSSKNTRLVLDQSGLGPLFDAVVDGTLAAREHLPGKPAPDTFLRAAELVGATPSETAVFEDAVVGVQAGRAGSFALVVGVDRGAGRQALRDSGADIVVRDLGEFPLV